MDIFNKKPTEKITVSSQGKFKIVSPDGTAENTKIYVDDTLVEGVTNININLDAETGHALASFTVLMPMFNIEIPVEKVKIIRTQLNTLDIIKFLHTNDLNTILDKEKAIDQNTTT